MKYISLKAFLKKWNLDRSDFFFNYLKDENTIPFDKNGKQIFPKDIFPDLVGEKGPYNSIDRWLHFELPDDNYEIRLRILKDIEEKIYLYAPIVEQTMKNLGLKPVQNLKKRDRRVIDKIKAQRLAKIYWKKDPYIIRPDMARFLKDKVKKKNGDEYTEDKIKDWLQDFDPHPLEGAPKKSQRKYF
jgi:hypothetical protein